MANDSRQLVIGGLSSASVSVSNPGSYKVDGKLSLPNISQGDSANSAVVAVISQNGSPVFTSSAGSEGFQVSMVCAANDVILVSLSSGAAVDQGKNIVKCVVAIG